MRFAAVCMSEDIGEKRGVFHPAPFLPSFAGEGGPFAKRMVEGKCGERGARPLPLHHGLRPRSPSPFSMGRNGATPQRRRIDRRRRPRQRVHVRERMPPRPHRLDAHAAAVAHRRHDRTVARGIGRPRASIPSRDQREPAFADRQRHPGPTGRARGSGGCAAIRAGRAPASPPRWRTVAPAPPARTGLRDREAAPRGHVAKRPPALVHPRSPRAPRPARRSAPPNASARITPRPSRRCVSRAAVHTTRSTPASMQTIDPCGSPRRERRADRRIGRTAGHHPAQHAARDTVHHHQPVTGIAVGIRQPAAHATLDRGVVLAVGRDLQRAPIR